MKVKITIAREFTALHVGEYDVAAEGDLEKAVADAMTQARAKAGFGANWGFAIHVDKA